MREDDLLGEVRKRFETGDRALAILRALVANRRDPEAWERARRLVTCDTEDPVVRCPECNGIVLDPAPREDARLSCNGGAHSWSAPPRKFKIEVFGRGGGGR